MVSFKMRLWTTAALALALFAVITLARTLHAQEPPKPPAQEHATQNQTDQNHANQPEHPSEAAKGEREEKAGGEADAIRHSPAVKWIAHITGLSDDQAYWICIGLNFAVIFVAIAALLRKKLPGFFSGRTAAIQKGIEEARKMSEEARQRLSEVEGRLSRLDTEIAGMRREADENARAEEQRILAAGEEERRRIVAATEQEIAMAANSARRELKTYAAELAVELAEKKIRVSKDTDEALVRAFTAQLGKDGN
jgi:F-type H+-transporting ATPase subunit b